MRKDCKYYLLGEYIRGKAKIMCNGKMTRGGHATEAWDNKIESSSKAIFGRVRMGVYCLLISES